MALSFGRYRVVDEVGRGGMGVVYRAHDPELDRQVAVKHIQLPADASRDVRDELEKRFRREAKAAARIRHHGVVAIHDVGTTDTGLYLVMELVDGESLGRRLERGAFPERAAAIELAARAADALAAAHRAGVVHRDVKPA
ncbi:MAG TPA: protein kinase, partial [Thermoanaerobaculia bacterium]|nr:protein kinase [Thermoanaerobaculia bacterium]